MKKNMIKFAKASKINLMLTLAALSLMLVTLLSVTYCWVEGSSSLNINDNGLSTATTNKAITISSTENKSVELNDYIDNADNLFLAPAKSTDGKTIQILDGDTYRNATVNDIGNNYIEFDFKLNCSEDTVFSFAAGSAITVDGSNKNPIKLAFSVDNAVPSKVFDADDISAKVEAFSVPASTSTNHIVTVRIWNQYDAETASNFMGKTVEFNLTLNATEQYAEICFVDKTTSEDKLYCTQDLSKLTLSYKKASGDTVTTTKNISSTATDYTFDKIPLSATDITISGYDSSNTLKAKWILPLDNITLVADKTYTYTAYGSLSTDGGTGTWNDVKQVIFNDFSYDELFKTQSTVSIYSQLLNEKGTMYFDSENNIYTAFVSVGAFSTSANDHYIYFNANNSDGTSVYYAQADTSEFNDISSQTSVTYSVFGKTKIAETGKDTMCFGGWYSSATPITFRDRTSGRALQSGANTIMVAASDTPAESDTYSDYYYAHYDSNAKQWYMNIPADEGKLTFRAYESESDSSANYTWDGSDRVKTGDDYIYSATAAKETGNSEGTWQYTGSDIADCPESVLNNTKVSFYAGVVSSWNPSAVMLAKTDTASEVTHQISTGLFTSAVSNVNYTTAKFVEVDSFDYYLKHANTYSGAQLGESAKGGAFYFLNSTGYGSNYVTIKEATTAETDLSPATVKVGATSLTLATELPNGIKSAAGTDLYIQYYINNNLVYTSNEAVTATDKLSNTASVDIKDYTSKAGTVEIKTVLTDGDVYYVADTDKLTVGIGKVEATVMTNGSESSAGGTVTINGKASPVDIAYNETAKFVAMENDGYYFVGWYDEDGNPLESDTTYSTTVKGDLSVTAKFASLLEVKATVMTNGAEDFSGGSVSISPATKVKPGTEVTFTATAKSGYDFVGWYKGDTELDEASTTYKTTENYNIIAKFETAVISDTVIYVNKSVFTSLYVWAGPDSDGHTKLEPLGAWSGKSTSADDVSTETIDGKTYAKFVISKDAFTTNGYTYADFNSIVLTSNGQSADKKGYLVGSKYIVDGTTKDDVNITPYTGGSTTETIYLDTNGCNWSNYYVYFFNSNGDVGASWPGTKLSNPVNGVYTITVPDGADSLVFNNGSGTQTSNISIENGKTYTIS